MHVCKELGNSSYFFAAICEGGPFRFVVLRVGVCVLFLWGGFPFRFTLYSLFYNMFLMMFIYVSFALLVIGYVCNLFSK
jgi:hypothetical protein